MHALQNFRFYLANAIYIICNLILPFIFIFTALFVISSLVTLFQIVTLCVKHWPKIKKLLSPKMMWWSEIDVENPSSSSPPPSFLPPPPPSSHPPQSTSGQRNEEILNNLYEMMSLQNMHYNAINRVIQPQPNIDDENVYETLT